MTLTGETPLVPILKWVGGKRQLLAKIHNYLGDFDFDTTRYFEPFLGGGALLFQLRPQVAYVNDMNEELISMYEIIRDKPHELIALLWEHKQLHNRDYYYRIREEDRSEEYRQWSAVRRAARLIYLNRTCYNGLFRVNSSGFFNTPMGRYKDPKIVNEDLIHEMSYFFNNSDIKFSVGDYKECLKCVRKGDFVYLDPPYAPLSKTSNFTSYTKDGFTLEDQEDLRRQCDLLNENGAYFLLSNSCCDVIKDLYTAPGYRMEEVVASRRVTCATRRNTLELMITNLPE